MDEVLRRDLRGRDSILITDRVERFFNEMKGEKEIYKSNDIGDVINEIEQTFSEKLTSDQVNRMMTLVRIFDGTPTAIKNGLVS